MFTLISTIRQLLALPVFLIAVLSGIFSRLLSARMYHLAWVIGHDEMMGLAVLAKSLPVVGPDLVRVMSAQMLEKHRSPSIAAYSGLLAMEAGDLEEAGRLMEMAKERKGDPQCLTELLEFQLASARAENDEEIWNLSMEMSQRRDLSPTAKKLAMVCLIWTEMWRGQFDRARERAEFILSIEDDPQMETILEAIHVSNDQFEAAQVCARRASSAPPANRLYWQALACYAVGLRELGEESLLELEKYNVTTAQQARAQILRLGSS